jgi:hypothetical protein
MYRPGYLNPGTRMIVGRVVRRSSCRILLVGALAIFGACAGDRPPSAVTETLPSGGIRVRSPAHGVWDASPDRRWRLVEEVRIGRLDGQGPDVFAEVGSLLVDAGGRVWVADRGTNELRVFDASGTYIRTVGRRGDGPGEYSRLASVLLGPEGNIWVDSGRRWEVFDTSGAWLARHPLDSNVGGGIRAWTDDGRLLEVGVKYQQGGDFGDIRSFYAVHSLDASGTLIDQDTLPTPPIPEHEAINWRTLDGTLNTRGPLPFSHVAATVIGPDGDMWITDGGGTYAIRRQTLEGDTLLIVEREFEPYPVSEADMAAAIDQMKPQEGWTSDDADPARIPRVYPPFLLYYPASDSTLWVIRKGEGGGSVLDVFDADGVYLGEANTNGHLERLRIETISSSHIYGVAKDDFDVDYVVVLKIEKP